MVTCHVKVVDDHGVPVNMPNQAERSSIIISSGSCDDHVVNHASRSSDMHQAGSLLVKLPLPPGTFPTLWKNDAGWGHCHSIFETYLSRRGHLYDSSSGSIFLRKPRFVLKGLHPYQKEDSPFRMIKITFISPLYKPISL